MFIFSHLKIDSNNEDVTDLVFCLQTMEKQAASLIQNTSGNDGHSVLEGNVSHFKAFYS